jgi:hypothetical protein
VKTELRHRPHDILPGESVVELWYDGVFIGQVTGMDGPGVRVFSKFGLECKTDLVVFETDSIRVEPTDAPIPFLEIRIL